MRTFPDASALRCSARPLRSRRCTSRSSRRRRLASSSSAPPPPRVDVPAPPTVRFEAPPPLADVEPGVQVVRDCDEEVFFSGGWYWHAGPDGVWYRTRSYRGGWVVAPRHVVPVAVMRLPRGQYRHFRGEGVARAASRGAPRTSARSVTKSVARTGPSTARRRPSAAGTSTTAAAADRLLQCPGRESNPHAFKGEGF